MTGQSGPTTVAVLGANGFLGRRLVTTLADAGVPVRAVLRPGSRQPAAWEGVEVHRADWTATGALTAALTGAGTVVHLASPLDGRSGAEAGAVEKACTASGVRSVVLAGSLSAHDWQAEPVIGGDTPLDPDATARGPYARSKILQENAFRDAAVTAPWDLRVVRLGYAWGPGRLDPGCVLRAGPLGIVVGPRRLLPLVQVDDAVAALVRAVETPGDLTVDVVDPRTRAWDWARATTPGPLVPVPYRLAAAAARAGSRALGRAGRPVPDLLRAGEFAARFRPVRYRSAAGLDWAPTTELAIPVERS